MNTSGRGSVGMGSMPETASIFMPEEWSEAADKVASSSASSTPHVALICGPKNSGKSTFSRHLVNVLLQREKRGSFYKHSLVLNYFKEYRRVAYLDTDVGQPEFTPPGCLALTVLDRVPEDLAVPCLKTPESLYDHYWKEYCMLDQS